jgi:hypothetical protein
MLKTGANVGKAVTTEDLLKVGAGALNSKMDLEHKDSVPADTSQLAVPVQSAVKDGATEA